MESAREPASIFQWGNDRPSVTLSAPGTHALGEIRFSADGKLLMARFEDETLRLWRTGQSEPFLTLSHRPLPGGALRTEFFNTDYDFTPDGRFVRARAAGQGACPVPGGDGVETARWAQGELINLILSSPDGRFLAATNLGDGKNRVVHVLTVPDLRAAYTFTLPSDPDRLAWSADSRVLVVEESDGNIASYDLRDGRRLPKAAIGTNTIGIHFLSHDRLLASQQSNSVKILNIATGREELDFPEIGPSAFVAAPGGDCFYVSSAENVVSRVLVESPLGFRIIPPPRAASYEISGGAFAFDSSPDGRWIASANRNDLLLTDVETGRLACDFGTGVKDSSDLSSVAFSADGHALYRCSTSAAFTRYPLVIRDGGNVEFGPGEALDTEPGFVIADESADRQKFVLLNYASGAVRIVAVRDGKLVTLSRWTAPDIYNTSLSPDGSQLLTNYNGQGPAAAAQRVRLYRTGDGSVIRELPGRVSCDTAWSADGRTAMTSNGIAESTLWDTADWHVKATLKGELGGAMTTFSISPDSEYAVVTHDTRIHFVSLRDGALLAGFESPGGVGMAASVRFLADKKRVGILWRDGRLDIVDPPAMRRGLSELGLAW